MIKLDYLAKDTSGELPIYSVIDKLFHDPCGILIGDEKNTDWLYTLQNVIQHDLKQSLVYRCVNSEKLDLILETGSDIPNTKKGSEIFATDYLEKCTEYGSVGSTAGEPLKNDLCVMLYDVNGLEQKRNSYVSKFLKDPKEVLKGILIFRNK